MSPPVDPYVAYLRGFFARWSPFYDAFAKPIGFAYGAAVRAAVARPGRRILDVATGTGEIALRAARRGAMVTAADFTPGMLARARHKARGRGIRFVEMDGRRLGFADRSFDVALLSFALHDMPRGVRSEVLREAARVTREGVVVLDYAPPSGGWRGRGVSRLLASFETAYLAGFLRHGGIAGAIAESGLVAERLARPLPGLFALYRASPPPAAAF